MKAWFETLEARERLFVAVGALFVVIVILYGAIWAPLASRHAALQTDVRNWQQSLAALRPLGAIAKSGGAARPANVSQQSPIIIVDQTLRGRALERYRKRSQPTTSNGVRVEFENVAFDELVLWLGDLSDQYSMHVQAGSFSPGSPVVAGRVNATLTLERAL